MTPLAKLTTGRQAVHVTSEVSEAFGGAGYVEDTGVPRLQADSQVLSIWEGTTNVLSLDALRALAKEGTLEAFFHEVEGRLAKVRDSGLRSCVDAASSALEHARAWVSEAMGNPATLEAGARRFSLTLGRTLEQALLNEHAQWCLDNGHGPPREGSRCVGWTSSGTKWMWTTRACWGEPGRASNAFFSVRGHPGDQSAVLSNVPELESRAEQAVLSLPLNGVLPAGVRDAWRLAG